MFKRFIMISLVLVVAFVFPFYVSASQSIKIAMGYIPNVQFAPYYIAKEMGYFSNEGLNVKFDYGMSTDIMSLVSQGAIDFGISDGDQVIVARSRGLKLKSVYAMYVKYPVCVVSLLEKGISEVSDLRGKRIGVPGAYGSNYIGLQLLLNSAGMSLRDIKLITIGYTQIESLLSNKVDAATVYVNNEVVVLKGMGEKVNVLRVSDVSPIVSAVIVTGDKMIQRQPALVRGFIRAVKRASEYIYNKNGNVMDILKKYIPTLTVNNIELNRRVLKASMDLWIDDDVKKHGFGYTTLSDWQRSIDALFRIGAIKSRVTPQECYTNEFLK